MCRLAFKTGECCLVFSRPTGAKLIGVFYTILFLFCLIGPIVELDKYRNKQSHFLNENGNGTGTVQLHKNVLSVIDEYGHMSNSGFEFGMILLVFCLLIGILVNLLMVWGVFVKFCWLLVPWLIFHLLVIITAFIAPILSIYYTNYIAPYGNIYEERKEEVLLSFFPILIGLVGIHFWLVVRRHFDELDEPPPAPAPAPADPPPATEDGKPKGSVVVNFFGPSMPGTPMKVAPAAAAYDLPSAPPKVVD